MARLFDLCLRVAFVALALYAAMASAAQTLPPDRGQLERKLTSTRTLIETSSGARQIEASGDAAAVAERTRARELHARAGDALRGDELESASKLLDEASRAMFAAVRKAAADQVSGRKERADFDARMLSTRALLEAQRRVAAEKNSGQSTRDVSSRVEKLLAEASEQARGGMMGAARRTLDQAYMAVKISAIGLRDGDTVVRSLNFASKAEEYDYEIDRNETHRMLVDMLLKEKRGAASVGAMVDQALAAAASLRSQAEAEAARRDHEAAVKTLEQSTRELVKAIRGAGVYIPG